MKSANWPKPLSSVDEITGRIQKEVKMEMKSASDKVKTCINNDNQEINDVTDFKKKCLK